MMIKNNNPNFSVVAPSSHFYDDDKWTFKEMGFSEEEIGSGNKSLNFDKIKADWLKDITKDFMLYKSKRVKPSRLCNMIMTLKKFYKHLDFIYSDALDLSRFLNPSNVDSFFDSVVDHKSASVHVYFSSLREFYAFLEMKGYISSANNFLPLDMKPKHELTVNPRPIPNKSVEQLKHACKMNDTFIKRFLNINLEVGARANEILLLKDESIHKSSLGWNLTRYESKSSRYITTPISDQCAEVILSQIELAKLARLEYQEANPNYKNCERYKDYSPYIFIHFYKNKFSKYCLRNVNYMSKKLIEEHDIRDENGDLLVFTSHMLRHTVASNLVESGVNQVFVQKYLGHKTPTMTNFYAQISEKKMRVELKFDEINQHELKDIYGNIYKNVEYDLDESLDGDLDKEWLRKNISAHILPNGICSLPIRQTCHHGNACLTCVSFRTGKQFKDTLIDQRERLIKIINIADEGSLRDQVLINTKTLEGLDKILEKIDE
ncbi:tyrosine-type recombinase/integrase [Marinomonas algarum]|uniref:Site-specific integrase n=1 Tax=Marinomonas algarum TaxID=2883105 RepID=A0A9X1IJH6_9GAMM|nr:site-specific integrase [Marinomonas algarum]MCB5160340.1 site-specific integrase [Marinomonas algarum]